MSSEQSSVNAETVEQTKQQIRGLVGEIAQLSKSDLEPAEYYAAFLQRVVSALAAVGGAVWVLTEGNRPSLAYQINLSDTLLESGSEDALRHMRLLSHVVRSGKSQLVPPLSGTEDERLGGNPTRYLLVLAPLQSEGIIEGMVEIFQRPGGQPNVQRGYARFLEQMCELASEWLKSRKLKQFTDRHSLWAQADHFSRLVHDSLDLRETAYTIVNEGRRLIGCDRVSVAILHGRKCRIEAISGQDTIENRSNIVTSLGHLATRVIATGEPLWYEGSTDDLPPQVEQAIDSYVDESYSKSIIVLPLRKPETIDQESARTPEIGEDHHEREIVGALIIEQIETDIASELLHPRVDLVYEHSARAISNALDYNNLFLMPVWRAIGKSAWLVRARTLPKTIVAAAAILTVLVGLFVIPGDFKVKSPGKLQPIDRRDVFVNQPGRVVDVLVRDGDPVEADQVLVELHDPDLTIEWEKVSGELQGTEQELSTAQRTQQRRDLSPTERIRVAGEVSQLTRRRDTLRQQLELVEEKRDQLKIKSPIAGQVMLPWDVEKSLLNRPVTPGQVLLTIADPSAEWELELEMPERRVGHVNRARRRHSEEHAVPLDKLNEQRFDLDVSYILATDPATTHHGMVRKVHPISEVVGEGGPAVRIQVSIDKSELDDPRPGATTTADVHCGRRPIGYCWFHEAIEWVQSRLLF